jgi:hypothetical protein
MLLRGVDFTRLLSLPTWGSMWMGWPTPYTVLQHVAVRRGDKVVCQVMSCPVAVVGSGAFLGDMKPPGLDIWWSVYRPCTYVTKSYMEYIIFTRACLSFVTVIMVFMCLPLVEPLCQTVMGRIPALECRLSGALGLLRPHPISPSNKCYCLPRPWWW